MNRREMLWLIGAAAASPAMAGAPTTAPLPVPRRAPRPPSTADLIDRYGASGEVGWALRDLDSGALVDGHQADRGFVPASVAKLPTAFYALATLGPEHRFRTRLLASGEVRNGMLEATSVSRVAATQSSIPTRSSPWFRR